MLIDTDVCQSENLLCVSNKPGLHWRVKTRNRREIPLLQEVQQVVRASVNGRRSGPVFLRRRFSDSEAPPPLSGRTVIELEREVQERIEAAEAASRLEIVRIARTV